MSEGSNSSQARLSGVNGGRKSCERGTEGILIGRIRSGSSRTGQALGWPGLAGLPFQGLNSAVALVLCDGAGGSEPLAHDEWGGLLPYVVRHCLLPGDGAETFHNGQWGLRGAERRPRRSLICKAGSDHTPYLLFRKRNFIH